jgi:metal-responsive CopG/Arc/MetJ family transcriptional regulator
MQSQLTVRLPEDLDRELANYAKRLRLKRSDIVRMALERFFGEPQVREERSPYGRVKHLLGSIESGIPDLGSRHREHLLKRIRKHA